MSHAGGGKAVTLGDFDADGDLDAFVATSGNSSDQLWYNDGFGFLIRAQQALGGGDGVDVALADFDGDGDLDTYVAQVGSDALWLNHPASGDTYPFDGLVRVEDLNRVRNHFGASGPADGTLPGDTYPFDGEVSIEDLNAVRNYFGGATPLPSPVPSRHSSGATLLDKPVEVTARLAVAVHAHSPASAFDAVFEMIAREGGSIPGAKRARGVRWA
ncbi:MAG: VCBS repeat-containing protein [Planctomycetia bacterium]|nr:VCBS repeat-containing protein [Planctomycetia bacterium]